ncbi:general transcription factor II-I repeat domain-containing protein 2 [Paramisgurnus dabryanus]|uniref:general transcription factor II-I repeat domain-containing protein 2 n=1 Tax=Paramisgurnus dabryanus TaxID=90735 RepID=UPI003CCFC330
MATSKKRKVDKEGRRFNERWKSEYFFTESHNNCVCLICNETVSVMKEYNVKRHYEAKHANSYQKFSDSEREDKVKQLEASLVSQQRLFIRAKESNENITRASYEVAILIAKHGKPFSEGEFVQECVMKIAENICPDKKQEFANLCLARNTIARRIEEISSDIKKQVTKRGHKFDNFSLACDESTDISDTAQLLIFLRGIDEDMNITEELLDLKSIKGQTRGVDLLQCVSDAVDDMKLPWEKLSGIVTDGAPAMTGERSGLASLLCNKVSEQGGNAIKLHGLIHQQVLCAKCLKFDHVVSPLVKAINFIRAKALYHRQFQQFLSDIEAQYGDVIYHNDVRWLSRGNALQRFFLLRREIGQFFDEKGHAMKELSDPKWLADLAFVIDINKHLNALNVSLQGKDAVVSQLYSHIKAFATKLQLFKRHLSQSEINTSHFPTLKEVMDCFPKETCGKIGKYANVIEDLFAEFNWRFKDFTIIEKDMHVFASPFSVDPVDVAHELQLELIDLQCDDELRFRHQQLSQIDFYRQLNKEKFPTLRALAKRMLSLFGSTYICEQTFSIMNLNKTRLRSRITDAHLRDVIRVVTTAVKPDLTNVLQCRSQFHPSH